MKTNRPAALLRHIMFVCLLLVMTLPQFVTSAGAVVAPAQQPQTGQTKCYDYVHNPDYSWSYFEIDCTGTGQDGETQKGIALPADRFTDNNDGTVTDKVTGLIWLKNANCFGVQTWSDAVTSSHTLADGACGLSDGSAAGQWRLPNIIELNSLTVLNGNSPVLPTGHPFTDIAVGSMQFYTSSDMAANGDLGGTPMAIAMADGNWEIPYGAQFQLWVAWPVRDGNASSATVHLAQTGRVNSLVPGDDGDLKKGVAWPDPRFTVNTKADGTTSNGTVTDNLTGLVWMQNANCNNGMVDYRNVFTWAAGLYDDGAGSICGLADGSKAGDWRIPNINEIRSLADHSKYYPAFPTTDAFSNLQNNAYWSSSSFNADYMLCGHLQDFGTCRVLRQSGIYAWAVRDYKASGPPDTTAPTVTFTTPGTVTDLTVTFTLSATDAGSGVAGYMVIEGATLTKPLANDSGWVTNAPTNYDFTTGGTKYLYGCAKDVSGNVACSAKKTITVNVDTTPPVVTVFTVPAASGSLTVTPISITATDVGGGVAAYMISGSLQDGPTGASDSRWSSTKPTSYTITACTGDGCSNDGTKTLYAWAKDVAGNINFALKSATVTLNTSVPKVTAFTLPAYSNSLTVPVSSFTGSDGVGVTGYLITASSTAPLATASGWSATKPASYIFASGTTDGDKTLYAWVKNAVGNVSAAGDATSASVKIDMAKPVVSAFTVTTPINSLTIPVTVFTATDGADATNITGYQITATATAPLATATIGWSDAAPTSYAFTAAGAKTLYAWVKDKAGNVSLAKTAAAVSDMTAPVVSAFITPATVTSLTVPITTLTATDNVAVSAYQITESSTPPAADDSKWSTTKPTSYTFADNTADGSKTLYAWAKDTAGNVSAASTKTSDTVTIDTTVPVVSDFSIPANFNSLTVPIKTFTVDGTGTAITGYQITLTNTAPTVWSTTKPVSFKVTAVGNYTFYAWVKDLAGNVSVSKSADVTVDMTKPVVSAFTVTTPVNSLTIPVTTFTATDGTDATNITGYQITATATAPLATATTGWSDTAPTSYTLAAAGAKTLYAWVKDKAGNVSLAQKAAVVSDMTAPVVSAFITPATVTSLTVPITTLTATDNVAVGAYQITESSTPPAADDSKWSTTKPTSYTFADNTADGSKTLYAWAKDTAGNVSAASTKTSDTVTIDTTVPVVSDFSIPANFNSLTVPIKTFTVDGTGTAITGYQITLTNTAPTVWSTTKPVSFKVTAVGNYTFYAWVKDLAGNVSVSKSATVTVDMVKPVVSAFAIPATASGLKVTITTLTATDTGGTGVAGYLITTTSTAPLTTATGWTTDAPADYTTTAGAKTLYAWAKDAAGNVSLAKSAKVTVSP